MTKPTDHFHFDDSAYDRPNDDWVCGWSGDGRPCPVGPTGRGRCQVEQICIPYLKEDRWHCNRPTAWGGKCPDGPMPDGECSHPVPSCQPARSLMSRRRALTFATAVFTVGALLIALGGDGAARFASPGELTAAHGYIGDDCAACHTAAALPVRDWALLAVSNRDELADSRLCRDCHGMDAHAFTPHSIPPDELAETTARMAVETGHQKRLADRLIDLVPDVGTADGKLACATCHREHHGREFSLTHLGEQQCQSCHLRRFDSFSNGHPEFGNYPGERRTRIQFDHGTHYGRHFALFERLMPDGSPPQSCATCHELDAAGRMMRVRGFEQSCAACHAPQIEDHGLPGVEFVRLPAVDLETLREQGWDVGEWPALSRRGFSHFLELLLSGDPDYVAAREALGDVPLDNLSGADASRLEAAATIVQATKRLVHELVTRREAALKERIAEVQQGGVDQATLRKLTGRPVHGPEFFDALEFLQKSWLPNLINEQPGSDGPDPQAGEGDSTVPADTPARIDGDVSFGNWYVDARDQSLRFRPAGHGDPLFSNWIEISAVESGDAFPDVAANDGPSLPRESNPVDRKTSALAGLLAQMTDPQTAGRCMKCHTLDRGDDGGLTVNWLSERPARDLRNFTKFAHAPHLTLRGESDACGECHSVNADFDLLHPEYVHPDGSVNTDPHSPLTSGIRPVARQQCMECHTSRGSGQSCLTCHNYHVRQFLPVVRTAR